MTPAYGPARAGAKPRHHVIFVMLVLATLFATRAAAQSPPPRLLILGDSLTAGFGLARPDAFQAQLTAALATRGIQVRLIDAAVSGDTTAGGRARLAWALADGADAALVVLGGNDGLRGLDPRATEANLAAILDALAARKIPVLLSGMLAPPNLGPDYGRDFQAVFTRLGTRQGVIFDPFFLEAVAADPTLNQPDRIHPNANGVARIVARLLPMVEALLREVGKP